MSILTSSQASDPFGGSKAASLRIDGRYHHTVDRRRNYEVVVPSPCSPRFDHTGH